MAVPSSGPLRLYADIGEELGVSQSNVSLRSMSNSAGFSSPDSMSEFYGYVDAIPPSVTTLSASSVTGSSMVLNGNVTSDGGGTITQRGFYFGTNNSSPTNNTKYTVSGTTGAFSLSRTSLAVGTYYIWAFATNVAGTTYGSMVTQTVTYQASLIDLNQSNTYGKWSPSYNTGARYTMRESYYHPQTSALILIGERYSYIYGQGQEQIYVNDPIGTNDGDWTYKSYPTARVNTGNIRNKFSIGYVSSGNYFQFGPTSNFRGYWYFAGNTRGMDDYDGNYVESIGGSGTFTVNSWYPWFTGPNQIRVDLYVSSGSGTRTISGTGEEFFQVADCRVFTY